jgi:DNA polymerase III alpha subunit
VLLAENNEGYQNLMKIVSKGFVDGYYYKPRVDMEVLQQYHRCHQRCHKFYRIVIFKIRCLVGNHCISRCM